MEQTLTPQENRELEELLRPSRIAVVATVGPTGMPQLTPNWYVYQNGRIAISTTKERIKYRNLSRDSRLAVCIYSEPGAGEYASVYGEAEIIDDDSIWPVTRAIVERYVEPQLVEARMRMLRTQDRIIISLSPQRLLLSGTARTTGSPRRGGPPSSPVGRP